MKGKTLVLKQNSSLPHLWIQNISGEIAIGDHTLKKADGLGISHGHQKLVFKAKNKNTFFLFRMN